MIKTASYVFLSLLILGLSRVPAYTEIIPVNYRYNTSYGNYYLQSLLMKENKWNRFPLTVNINRLPKKYRLTAIRAINRWGQYIPLKISKEASDITIAWGYRLPSLGSEFVGQTDHTYKNGIHKCLITVKYKRHYSAMENEEILIHELGHAFGLDHSHNSNDIMFNTIKPCKNSLSGKNLITPRDLNTLYLIYSKV